jgi:hypothetical protein
VSIFGGQATGGGAATPAASAATDPVDLVNQAAGSPAAERYPGAVSPDQYAAGRPGALLQGGPAGPAEGTWGTQPFGGGPVPMESPGGGYQDASWTTGHDGPQSPWDSSAGAAFAPSGALDPDLHGEDLGAAYVRERVIPASIGKLTRRTMTGQTTVTQAETLTEKVGTSPNGRQDLDQQQWHDPDGYNPWTIPYAERPVLNNLAHEAVPFDPITTAYGVSGYLPDRSPYDAGLAVAYEAPPDPAVTTVPVSQSASNPGIGGGWVLT